MIVFEGIDCIGKTTAINFVKDRLIESGRNVVVLNDWVSDYSLKEKFLKQTSAESQLEVILEARNRTKQILSEIPKDTIVLYDRYVLSTIVYQVLKWNSERSSKPKFNPELLKKILDSSVPYKLVYICPTEDFNRDKFLNKRSKKDKYDKLTPFWNLKSYWYIMTYPNLLNIKLPEHYIVRNDGTSKFFGDLEDLSKSINTTIN